MSSARFIIGLTVFGLGVFLLLESFQMVTVDWALVGQLWPVLLIVWGISLLAKKPATQYLLALIGIIFFACLFIYGSQQSWFHGWQRVMPMVTTDTLSAAYQAGTAEAALDMNVGAGTFIISGTTTDLARGDVVTSLGHFTLTQTGTTDRPHLFINQESDNNHFWNPARWHDQKNSLSLSLNPNPVWTLVADTGASKVDFDLSAYKVQKLTLDTGASDATVTLGRLQAESTVNISAGASKLLIRVPSGSGVEVQVDAGASSKDFVGLVQVEKDKLWRSTNFDTAADKLFISIDAGASNLRLEQY